MGDSPQPPPGAERLALGTALEGQVHPCQLKTLLTSRRPEVPVNSEALSLVSHLRHSSGLGKGSEGKSDIFLSCQSAGWPAPRISSPPARRQSSAGWSVGKGSAGPAQDPHPAPHTQNCQALSRKK